MTAKARYCLGKSPPARSPRPAATTTAATVPDIVNSHEFASVIGLAWRRCAAQSLVGEEAF